MNQWHQLMLKLFCVEGAAVGLGEYGLTSIFVGFTSSILELGPLLSFASSIFTSVMSGEMALNFFLALASPGPGLPPEGLFGLGATATGAVLPPANALSAIASYIFNLAYGATRIAKTIIAKF